MGPGSEPSIEQSLGGEVSSPPRQSPPPQSTLPPPPLPTQTPEPAPDTGGSAWYNGPLPIKGLVQRESTGAAIGRTAVKSLTALLVLGFGLFVLPILLFSVLAGIAAAAGGGGGASSDADSASFRTTVEGEYDADITLAMVPVTGVILTQDRGDGGGFFAVTNQTYGYTVKEVLADLAEDDDVDGIILEVDSPGGTVTGSKAIADGVAAYQEETGKPVVAFVSGFSASGGVYSMAGADEIYADHGTLIGSIGVIFGPFSYYDGVTAIDGGILGGGVTTENGVTVEYITAGRSKDFGNPYRPMTDEERSVLQEGVDDAYDEFVAHVAEGRDIPGAEIEKEMGALVFGEQQAVNNGLIDGIADRDATYELAAKAAGLEDGQTWRIERVESGPPSFFGSLASAGANRLDSTESSSDASTGAAACLGSGTLLAYHGDPSLLCKVD